MNQVHGSDVALVDRPWDGAAPQVDALVTKERDLALAVLESALATSDYLLGPAFPVADLNVASVLSWARFGKVDLSAYAKVTAWLRQCFARPASRKVAEMARS